MSPLQKAATGSLSDIPASTSATAAITMTPSSTGLPTGIRAGIGVGVTLGVVALTALLWFSTPVTSNLV